MKRLIKLWREDRGAAIIELAFVAPVIALMTVGVVDLSNGFGTKLKVEQAAQRSVEKVMQTTGITNVETTIADEAICQFNGTFDNGDCKTAPLTTANVTVAHSLYCNNVVSTAPRLHGRPDRNRDGSRSPSGPITSRCSRCISPASTRTASIGFRRPPG